jgi:hypothetical protein
LLGPAIAGHPRPLLFTDFPYYPGLLPAEAASRSLFIESRVQPAAYVWIAAAEHGAVRADTIAW